jgi:large conductance mechanosensitive channel
MPVVGYFTGGIDFSQMYVQLKGAAQPTLADARKAGATIAYGNFITIVINFLIVAGVLFLVVKMMNRLKRQPPPAAPEPVKLSRQEELLVEIRDALKKRA